MELPTSIVAVGKVLDEVELPWSHKDRKLAEGIPVHEEEVVVGRQDRKHHVCDVPPDHSLHVEGLDREVGNDPALGRSAERSVEALPPWLNAAVGRAPVPVQSVAVIASLVHHSPIPADFVAGASRVVDFEARPAEAVVVGVLEVSEGVAGEAEFDTPDEIGTNAAGDVSTSEGDWEVVGVTLAPRAVIGDDKLGDALSTKSGRLAGDAVADGQRTEPAVGLVVEVVAYCAGVAGCSIDASGAVGEEDFAIFALGGRISDVEAVP